jgi:hypothetical protein
MAYQKITIVAQILLQKRLIIYENLNVFADNEGNFQSFIEPERVGVNMDFPLIFSLPKKFL